MKIEMNIPMSKRYNRTGWDELPVDGSVFFDDEPRGAKSNIAFSARSWAKRHGRKFSARKEGNGVRIWRVL